MRHLVAFGAACLLILTLALYAGSQGSGSVWSRTFGGTDTDEAWSVIQTSDGGYAIAGYTGSHGAGLYDFYLVKTDSEGNEEWSRTYGGTNWDYGYSVIQTSDGGYAIAGHTSSYGAGWRDFWLMKTDNSGNEEWNKTYGGTGSDRAHSVIQTSDGGYALAGYTDSYGAGGWDFWLVKTDPLGNEEWSGTYGDTGNDLAYSVTQTSDGGYVLVGYTDSYGTGGKDILLVKTDPSGNEKWSTIFGGENGDDEAYSVIQTSDNGYLIVGYTTSYGAGGEDFYLVRTDPSGNEMWSVTFGGEHYDRAYSLAQTSDGGYAIAGHTGSYGAGLHDFYLVKIDASENEEWSRTFGGGDDDYAYSVVQTSDGGYALVGYTKSYGAGGEDFWFVRVEFPGFMPTTVYVIIGGVAVVGLISTVIWYRRFRIRV